MQKAVAQAVAPPATPFKPSGNGAVVQRELAGISKSGHLSGYSDAANKLKINKTKVGFDTDTLATTKETVGVKMIANPIGPDHPMGTAPDISASQQHIAQVNLFGDTYIRGHLLNGNIGGPGKAENLFPITMQANSRHYQDIERYVVSWVNDDKTYVHYEVEVKNRNDKTGYAELHCFAEQLDATGKPGGSQVKAIIISDPKNSSSAAKVDKIKGTTAFQDPDFSKVPIELQKGKLPVEYDELEEEIVAEMEKDKVLKSGDYASANLLERKLKTILGDKGVETVIDAYMSNDIGVVYNTDKKAWNGWMKKIRDNYQSITF